MTDRPIEYDPRFCAIHTDTLNEIVSRVQKLVDQYHDGNVKLERIEGRVDMIAGRVPVDLQQQLTALTVQYGALHRDFSMLRTQWYSLIGLICTGFVAGLVAFVIGGGLAR